MAEQNQKAFQKQDAIFVGKKTKVLGKKVKGATRYYRSIGLGFKTPKSAIEGIYAAGDLTYGGHQNTNTAIHMGNMAAAWMVFDLSHDHREDAADVEEVKPQPETGKVSKPAPSGQGAYDLLPERRRAI